jgi:superfamily II DNA or RNA helicase
MERAISEGILCNYDYHPHIVQLTADELEEYAVISKKLSRLFSAKTGSFTNEDLAQMLLMKRKRIIHKATNKLGLTRKILEERFKREGNLKYTFIYVPEGITTEPSENDLDDAGVENIRLIHQYTRAVGQIDSSILVNQFVSGMPDRDQVLDQFKEGKIQVIASMKCLDEGVDIPRAEHAIFCSSTGNPRQFIQRRGRILRKHPDKLKAVIHDLIVVPDLSASGPESETYNLEKTLVRKELERVMYFASLSNNPLETEDLFVEVCNHYDLNIYTIHQELQAS